MVACIVGTIGIVLNKMDMALIKKDGVRKL
jgi:hypothetical protein